MPSNVEKKNSRWKDNGHMWCNMDRKGKRIELSFAQFKSIFMSIFLLQGENQSKLITRGTVNSNESYDEDWSINRPSRVCHWNLYGVDFFNVKWKRTVTRQWMVRSTITCCRKWRWQESGTSSWRKRSDKEALHFLPFFRIIPTYEEIQVHAEVVIHNCAILLRGNQLGYKL